MKNILSKKLFESPDSIQALDPKYHYMKTIASFDDSDAYPFGFINGKMFVGEAGKTHFDFLPPEALNDVENNRSIFEYPGRIWIDKKLISFWKYPRSNSQLKSIIKSIENAFKTKGMNVEIWNDPDYRIEVNKDVNNTLSVGDEDPYYGSWVRYKEGENALIPLHNYISSEDYSDEVMKQAHVQSNSEDRYKLARIKRQKLTDLERERSIKDYKERGTEPYMKWKYAHKNENKINENADSVLTFDLRYDPPVKKFLAFYNDPNNYTFLMHNNKVYLSQPQQIHVELIDDMEEELNVDHIDPIRYEGRIWPNKKLISFYDYPMTNEILKKIVRQLEHRFKERGIDIKIWDDPEYKIDIEMPILKMKSKEPGVEYTDENKYNNIIPLKSYKGGEKPSTGRVVRAGHTTPNSKVRNIINKMKFKKLSPEEKRIAIKDYDKRGTEPYMKWKHAHKFENIKNFNKYKLFETPDTIVLNNGRRLKFSDVDSCAFGIFENEMLICSSHLDSHADLIHDYIEQSSKYNSIHDVEEYYGSDLESYDGTSTILQYPGRIWLNGKAMSFYTYPEDLHKLKIIIERIEEAYLQKHKKPIKIWDDPAFKIEIILNQYDVLKYYPQYSFYFKFSDKIKYILTTIPLKEYKFSENIDDSNIIDIEDSQFMIAQYNAIYNGKKRIKNFKNKKTYGKGTSKHLKWQYAHKYENLDNINDLKLFESPDRIIAYDIEGKPRVVAFHFESDARTFAYADDNLTELMVGKLGEHHSNIEYKYQKETGKKPAMKLEGRIWLDKKYISFYDYPKSKSELEKTIHDIEKQLKINEDLQIDIWNDPDFRIEIPMSIDEIDVKKQNIVDNKNKYINLIPLKSYEGDNDINNDQIIRVAHTNPSSKFRGLINKMKWKRLSDEEKKVLTKDYDKRGTNNYMKWKYAHKQESIILKNIKPFKLN